MNPEGILTSSLRGYFCESPQVDPSRSVSGVGKVIYHLLGRAQS